MNRQTSPVQSTITVLIAVGVRFYREGLLRVLSGQPGITVVGAAADHDSAVSQAQALRPAIILLDITIPDSLTTVQALRVADPMGPVIALSVAETDVQVIAYAEAGVSGYVTCENSLEDLVATIRSVESGELLCSPRIAAALLRQVTKSSAGLVPEIDCLTGRQLEVASLLDRGLSNKEIASSLHIEVSTVKNHVHSILEKLRVKRRGEAAARVRRLSPGRADMYLGGRSRSFGSVRSATSP